MQVGRAKILKHFGQWSFGIGALVVAFLGFQLWGTAIVEDSAQQQLAKDFAELTEVFQPELASEAEAESVEATDSDTDSDGESSPGDEAGKKSVESNNRVGASIAPDLAPSEMPLEGEPIGIIRIPTIGLDKVMVQGVGLDELRDGPGHYSGSPLPGQRGNSAIAGHRTTYGAPFGDLDLLNPGDVIEVETFQGLFEYEVLPQQSESGRDLGHFIVGPSDTYVIEDYGDNRLTLTACHPKYTANERIVVHAALISPDSRFSALPQPITDSDLAGPADPPAASDPLPADAPRPVETVSTDSSPVIVSDELGDVFGWHTEELPAVIVWALLCATVLAVARLVARRRKPLPTYSLATPAFLAALWVCFTHLDRLLPAI